MRTILSGVAPIAALLWLFVLSGAISVMAQQLDVDIVERASEDLDTCSYGQDNTRNLARFAGADLPP